MSDAPTTPAHAGIADAADPTGRCRAGARPGAARRRAAGPSPAHTCPASGRARRFTSRGPLPPGTIVLGDAASPGRAVDGCAVEVPRGVGHSCAVGARPHVSRCCSVTVTALAALMRTPTSTRTSCQAARREVADETPRIADAGARDGLDLPRHDAPPAPGPLTRARAPRPSGPAG
jgi:hypothetical protein